MYSGAGGNRCEAAGRPCACFPLLNSNGIFRLPRMSVRMQPPSSGCQESVPWLPLCLPRLLRASLSLSLAQTVCLFLLLFQSGSVESVFCCFGENSEVSGLRQEEMFVCREGRGGKTQRFQFYLKLWTKKPTLFIYLFYTEQRLSSHVCLPARIYFVFVFFFKDKKQMPHKRTQSNVGVAASSPAAQKTGITIFPV